ncbi:hypothetical protein SPIRO4BDMA_70201 [uncultured spirochete]|uniref:Uncharacterized protein n=1 Tax=uncultured spirochete TaxID=156406 RepID=A0A3P3XUN9_9SPIR|nr:hypothetical protein SPIRO4BDMA_70201 [uncultured spirochete]
MFGSLVLYLVDEIFDGHLGHGSFFEGADKTAFNFLPLKRLAPAVTLNHQKRFLLDALVTCKS